MSLCSKFTRVKFFRLMSSGIGYVKAAKAKEERTCRIVRSAMERELWSSLCRSLLECTPKCRNTVLLAREKASSLTNRRSAKTATERRFWKRRLSCQ